MKPVHFRGVNYDPLLLVQLVTRGTRQIVHTNNIVTLIASRSCAVCIAVVVDTKYHLLTGCLAPNQDFHNLVTIGEHQLRQAEAPQMQYGERRQAARQVVATERDFTPHLSSQPNMRNAPRIR
jgi:hypothetical protein